MNILFIYSLNDVQSTSKPLWRQNQIAFGISYISSFLKKHGHITKLIVLSKLFGKKNKNIINKYLKSFCPKLICFAAVATEWNFIRDIATYIKSINPNVFCLIGGPFASLSPDVILSNNFDALCIGEGEYPTLELVTQLEKGEFPSSIPNLWIKHGSVIERNSSRPFLENLDSLPFPDREIWQEWIAEYSESSILVLISRGCPFQCTYCCNHAFSKLAPGTYVRFRTPENIIQEIKQLIERFPRRREFFLESESIGINKNWSLQLCSELALFNATLNRPLSFLANLRITPQADLEDLFTMLKKSNFNKLYIGLESGSERIRYEILKRNYSNQDVINTVKLARRYGLKIYFYNMIGVLGETVSDFKETVKINRMCLPDNHCTSIFFPYPGTDLYFLCREKGLLGKPFEVNRERFEAALDLPGFSKKQIQRSFNWFDYYVYKGRKPLYKILVRVSFKKLQSNYYWYYLYRKVRRYLPFFELLANVFREYDK
ncbi:MAG: radical SAM protein [Candidatus Omnitrophota bacterium]|nr:radical SAM protein [Candidatus Omnitrophota bacterium]